jgi:hypothetical protein
MINTKCRIVASTHNLLFRPEIGSMLYVVAFDPDEDGFCFWTVSPYVGRDIISHCGLS